MKLREGCHTAVLQALKLLMYLRVMQAAWLLSQDTVSWDISEQ